MIQRVAARSLLRWAISLEKSSGDMISDPAFAGGVTSTIVRHMVHRNGIQDS